jgi:hypothetical protein
MKSEKLKLYQNEAYWISPNGEILPVDKNHIATVFDNPWCFGITMAYLESIYLKYNEPLRSENQARAEILKELFTKGWIRARRYQRPDRWSININDMNVKTVITLKEFANSMIVKGHSKYDDVYIDSLLSKYSTKLGELNI